jgi:hypothetical protein
MIFSDVDKDGKSTPHGVVVKPSEAEDIELEERAKALLKK